jgi:hypothetical protein
VGIMDLPPHSLSAGLLSKLLQPLPQLGQPRRVAGVEPQPLWCLRRAGKEVGTEDVAHMEAAWSHLCRPGLCVAVASTT